uniref:Uncharacterized protein n=1 Tax=Physcomitrium patens TaxID=3218 RepID=A0A2K1J4S4_PHYPA|nr:hypothetical protein PHYPA_022380 [Physcomitrium patens]
MVQGFGVAGAALLHCAVFIGGERGSSLT